MGCYGLWHVVGEASSLVPLLGALVGTLLAHASLRREVDVEHLVLFAFRAKLCGELSRDLSHD